MTSDGEAALLLDLAGLRRHLVREVLGQLDGGEEGRQDMGDHAQHDARLGRGAMHLEHAQRLAVVHQREPFRPRRHRGELVEAGHARARLPCRRHSRSARTSSRSARAPTAPPPPPGSWVRSVSATAATVSSWGAPELSRWATAPTMARPRAGSESVSGSLTVMRAGGRRACESTRPPRSRRATPPRSAAGRSARAPRHHRDREAGPSPTRRPGRPPAGGRRA